LDDRDGLLQEAEEARDLGFTGKGAIHPAQLATIQAAFTPSAQELADAAAVVAAADRTGDVITTVNGRMVGPPLVAAARLLTAQAADRHPASEES
jgi:(S)-citramalyl-CoA lyase